MHSLKFHAVAILNGLIVHLHGPIGKNLIYSLVKLKNNTLDKMAKESRSLKRDHMGCLILFIIDTCQNIYQK